MQQLQTGLSELVLGLLLGLLRRLLGGIGTQVQLVLNPLPRIRDALAHLGVERAARGCRAILVVRRLLAGPSSKLVKLGALRNGLHPCQIKLP